MIKLIKTILVKNVGKFYLSKKNYIKDYIIIGLILNDKLHT